MSPGDCAAIAAAGPTTRGPARTAFAAFALGLAVCALAPGPARAQALEATANDTVAGTDAPEAAAADPPNDTGAGADAPETTAADPPPLVQAPSGAAAQIADWVTATGDNGGRPFVIVDKVAADVFVFSADGRLQGKAPVLVGLARGDDSAPGVGDLALSAIRPDERTTPAGRFVMKFGAATEHRTVLWVDYPDAISLHPVITTNPSEHRLERIRSPAPEDHRITYGCINVPASFYTDVVVKTLGGGVGVAYILPDTKPLGEVFPGFAVATGGSGSDAAGSQGLGQARGPDGPSDANAAVDTSRSGAPESESTGDAGAEAAASEGLEQARGPDASADANAAVDASPSKAPDSEPAGDVGADAAQSQGSRQAGGSDGSSDANTAADTSRAGSPSPNRQATQGQTP